MTPPKADLKTPDQARGIMDAEAARAGLSRFSTHFDPKKGAPAEAKHENWWREHTGSSPPADSPRTIAYLRAYLAIAGEDRLFADGLRLDGGEVIRLDRAVIKALLNGYIQWIEGSYPRFALTDLGRELVARPDTLA